MPERLASLPTTLPVHVCEIRSRVCARRCACRLDLANEVEGAICSVCALTSLKQTQKEIAPTTLSDPERQWCSSPCTRPFNYEGMVPIRRRQRVQRRVDVLELTFTQRLSTQLSSAMPYSSLSYARTRSLTHSCASSLLAYSWQVNVHLPTP